MSSHVPISRQDCLTAVWNLIRWLRSNSCEDYASQLEQEAQFASTCPTAEAEAARLTAIEYSLAYVYNHPPRSLKEGQYTELKDVRHQAIISVQHRKRQIERERADTVRIVKKVQQFVDGVPMTRLIVDPPVPLLDKTISVADDSPANSALSLPQGSRPSPAQEPHSSQQRGAEMHPDGPEGGRWVWWKNQRLDVPQGNVYRMIAYMWHRNSASYDDLVGPVFDNSVDPQTVRSLANKVKNALKRIGVPWRLKTDSTNRYITKEKTDQ